MIDANVSQMPIAGIELFLLSSTSASAFLILHFTNEFCEPFTPLLMSAMTNGYTALRLGDAVEVGDGGIPLTEKLLLQSRIGDVKDDG